MDGTRQEVPVRLIAASIPLQALMIAGAAIVALGAATHGQPAPAVPDKPVPACWNIGMQSQPGGEKAVPVAGRCMMNVAPGGLAQPTKIVPLPVKAVPVPCCGG